MWWRKSKSDKYNNTELLKSAMKQARASQWEAKERALEHRKGQQELRIKHRQQKKGREQPKQLANMSPQANFERQMRDRLQKLKTGEQPKQLANVPPQQATFEREYRDRLQKLKSGMPKDVYLTLEAWRAGECANSADEKNACVCEFLQKLLGTCQITAKQKQCTNVAKIFEKKVVGEQADINKLYKWAQSFRTTGFVDMPCLK